MKWSHHSKSGEYVKREEIGLIDEDDFIGNRAIKFPLLKTNEEDFLKNTFTKQLRPDIVSFLIWLAAIK